MIKIPCKLNKVSMQIIKDFQTTKFIDKHLGKDSSGKKWEYM